MKANIKRNVMYAVWAVAWVAVAALLSYLWNDTQSQWYMSLVKPAFQPPGFVFAIAWSILYALIAADLFLLFRAGGSSRIIYPFSFILSSFYFLSFKPCQGFVMPTDCYVLHTPAILSDIRISWD